MSPSSRGWTTKWLQARLLFDAVVPARTLVPGAGPRRWARFMGLLSADPDALGNEDRAAYASMRLAIGVRGAALLLRGGREARARRLGVGEGLAQYELPDSSGPFWVEVTRSEARAGWGDPPRAFTARVRFSSVAQAIQAQGHRLDIPAEVGAGRMSIEGRLPLIDGLDAVMRDVERLLEG